MPRNKTPAPLSKTTRMFGHILFLSALCLAATSVFAQIAPLEAASLHNVFRLTTNVFSGSSPESTADFEALRNLGVKTIISVDGAQPDVEAARRAGLRYVHLPHGYDGISTNTQARLAKAAVTLEGPIFVHCHHGKHRGPAAAAILCMTRENWSASEAEAWLHRAGTSTNYKGLFASVREFKKPTQSELAASSAGFPARAEVSSVAKSMVDVDRHFENLKLIRAAKFQTPAAHPDLNPANEAVILMEHFREAQRILTVKTKADLLQAFARAEEEARELEALFRTSTEPARLEKAFEAVGKSCARCHRAHRD